MNHLQKEVLRCHQNHPGKQGMARGNNPPKRIEGLRRLRESGDWGTIIIDTPPVLAVTDTLVVAPQVSGMLVLVNTGNTNRRSLVAAADSLTRIGARVLGLVVLFINTMTISSTPSRPARAA